MFYEEDWLLRQIKLIIDTLARVLKSSGAIKSEELGEDYREISEKIDSLLDRMEINEAENYIYDNIKRGDYNYLSLVLEFYDRINGLTDEELEEANFSRKEIYQGIEEIIDIYSLSYLIID